MTVHQEAFNTNELYKSKKKVVHKTYLFKHQTVAQVVLQIDLKRNW